MIQSNLNEWLIHYKTEHTHQGKQCNKKTPIEAWFDGKAIAIWKEKVIARI
ncbi:IS481 family transposase [Endozoicomonas elysicola]|uniref:IS481 family transposase n=1 Tax=Endozoicomonas elysicola TaxID=305900 RepID=UPI00036E3A96|nr:IS481 family transposase [Endozoicomonas elysicola]